MTQENSLKPFVWIMGTETKKMRTGKKENPINEKKMIDKKDMIEFYVRLFLNQIEYNFSITNKGCLDKILTSITTCESSYRSMDTKLCSKILAWPCYNTEPLGLREGKQALARSRSLRSSVLYSD
jgi:hypothetical protein